LRSTGAEEGELPGGLATITATRFGGNLAEGLTYDIYPPFAVCHPILDYTMRVLIHVLCPPVWLGIVNPFPHNRAAWSDDHLEPMKSVLLYGFAAVRHCGFALSFPLTPVRMTDD
jgi:hypothetical protein